MTYDDLVAAVKAYADRQDLEVANNMDVFIIMAEARINRRLKTREQSARIYTPTVSNTEYYTLPPDFAGMRNIQLNSNLPHNEHSTCPMAYLNPEQFDRKRDEPYEGTLYYTVIANQIQIHPMQDAGKSLEITYYQKVPRLTRVDVTNWLSDAHPDIYLSGMLCELETFVKNYDVASTWDAKMTRMIDELETSDFEEIYSGSSLSTRLEI